MTDQRSSLQIELLELEWERLADPARGLERVRVLRERDGNDVAADGRLMFLNGLFLKQLLRVEEADVELRRAITWAADHGLADVEARARANLAVLLADLGSSEESSAQLEAARRGAPPSAQGLVAYLDALLQQRRGDHHDALGRYLRAQTLLEKSGDFATVAALRLNRAIGLIYLDDVDGARRELALAETTAVQLGLETLAALVAQNLGFAHARRGYLADGLAAFDRAERRFNELSRRPKQALVVQSDRAEVLLQAGLAEDARLAVSQAVFDLEADGIQSELSEARLLLARVFLALGEYERSKEVALLAAWEFHRAQRSAWVRQALYVGRQAEYFDSQGRGPNQRLVLRLQHLAGKLIDQGWPVEGRDALVLGALVALEGDDRDRAASLLTNAGKVRAGGTMQHRARHHLARAELLSKDGNDERAAATVRRGVQNVLEVVNLSGSPEARVEGLRFAGQLTGFGTRLALRTGSPISVMRAVELQRSVAQELVPSSTVADDLEPGAEEQGLTGPEAVDTENAIRQRSLRSRPEPGTGMPPMAWRPFRRATMSRNFVYYVEENTRISAVVVRGRATHLVEVASVDEITEAATFLDFAMTRVSALGSGNSRGTAALHREIAAMRRLLVEPLPLQPGPIVVVPSPSLHAVPWGLLAGDGQEISLASSGAAWLRASGEPVEPAGRVVLVGGPGLEAGEEEVLEIQSLYPQAEVLIGPDGTVRNVLDSFAEADLVHVAAHGHFRADSPMFSKLELHDGPLTLDDLQRLRRLPSLVVLPACEVGAAKVYQSGGVLGTAAALVSLGARTVVAPLQPIVDHATRDNMVSFHKHLLADASPARAMHNALRETIDTEDWDRFAAAATFVVSGVG